MKWLLTLLGLLLGLGANAQEKVVYVVPGVAGTGASWTDAIGTVEGALRVAGVTEVRLRWGIYTLSTELAIPQNVRVTGGWNVDGVRWAGGTEQTVLQGNGQRIATVAGVLDGVTVKGGVAAGKNGGGLYVKATGKVVNCMIRDNLAAEYYPQVGDVQLKDGRFLSRDEITVAHIANIRGVVFWVNPALDAPEGKRGWLVVKTGAVMTNMPWAERGSVTAENSVTGHVCESLEEAVTDTAGWTYSHAVDPVNCKIIKACLDYAPAGMPEEKGKWYLPAAGQLRCLFNEHRSVIETYAKINGSSTEWDLGLNSYSSSEGLDKNNGQVAKTWGWVFGGQMGGEGFGRVIMNSKTSEGLFYIPVTSF